MKNIAERNMPVQEPVSESGAEVVMHELSILYNELNEVVNRCANRISPILRADRPDAEKPATRRELESELFNSIYCYVADCRAMITHLHSILDRVDL